MNKRNLVIIGIILFLSFASVVLFISKKRVNRASEIYQVSDEKYFNGEIEESRLDFWINNQGNADNIFHSSKGKNIEIRLNYKTEGDPIDPERVEIKLNGVNGRNKILPINFSKPYLSTYAYVSQYTANNIGTDKIEVNIKNSPIEFGATLHFYDNSYVVESDINSEQVSFNVGSLLIIENKSVESPKLIDTFSENFFDGFETPGKVRFFFKANPKNEMNKEAFLDVYTVTSQIDKLYNSPYTSESKPIYLSNFKKLNSLLQEYPEDLDSVQLIPDFPPVNASSGGAFGRSYIKFKNGKGVRFLVPGYFQAYDPAKHPVYVFQGITDDGKHHIVFRYTDVFSPNLAREFKNSPKDIKDLNSWIPKTFEAVKNQKESGFVPNVREIDKFIESIEIK